MRAFFADGIQVSVKFRLLIVVRILIVKSASANYKDRGDLLSAIVPYDKVVNCRRFIRI